MPHPKPKHLTLFFIALMLCAFALRLTLHDFHGLEGDDGVSLELTRVDTPTLIDGLRRMELDVHPPLHFLALKYWIAIAGDSLLSLRLSNIFADMLMGALLIRLAGRVFNWRVGLMAGVLWLSAPLLLHTAYPIRMYMLLGVFVTAGLALLVDAPLRVPTNPRIRRNYGGAAFMGLLAAYTHILGVIALAGYGAMMGVQWLAGRVRLKAMLLGWGWLLLSGILFLPFALPIWNRFTAGDELGAQNAELLSSRLSIPAQVIATLFSHRVLPIWAGWLILLFLIVGAFFLWRRYAAKALPLIAFVGLSLLGMMVLAAASDLYKPRYLAPFVPAALILIAAMIDLLRPRWLKAGVLIAALLISGTAALDNLQRDTRDDWQIAANFIETHAGDDDGLLIIPAWGAKAFNYHYTGEIQADALLSRVEPDADLDALLTPLVENHPRIWHIRYQPLVADPDDRVNRWLSDRAPALMTVFPSGMQITAYDFAPRMNEPPAEARLLDAVFGDVARLHAVEMPLSGGRASDTRLHPPSNRVHVTLYWESLQSSVDFIPRVRLTDSIGQVYGSPLDGETTLLQRHPITTWESGDIWRLHSQLNLNPQTPPATYNIEVMVLDPATAEPLTASGADAGDFWVIAGTFKIHP